MFVRSLLIMYTDKRLCIMLSRLFNVLIVLFEIQSNIDKVPKNDYNNWHQWNKRAMRILIALLVIKHGRIIRRSA
jgi:hypothetical protein